MFKPVSALQQTNNKSHEKKTKNQNRIHHLGKNETEVAHCREARVTSALDDTKRYSYMDSIDWRQEWEYNDGIIWHGDEPDWVEDIGMIVSW